MSNSESSFTGELAVDSHDFKSLVQGRSRSWEIGSARKGGSLGGAGGGAHRAAGLGWFWWSLMTLRQRLKNVPVDQCDQGEDVEMFPEGPHGSLGLAIQE